MTSSLHASPGLRRLAGLLFFAAIVALVLHHATPFQVEPGEYASPALQFAHTGRIDWVFFPVGYPALLGLGMKLFGDVTGAALVNIAIYLLFVAGCWGMLRNCGLTTKHACWIGALFALYPEELWSINRIYQTNLTNALVLLYTVVAIVLVRQRTRYSLDALLSFVFGISVVCRSNLLLLSFVTGWLLWHYRLPHALLRFTGQMAGAALVYAVITIAVHGSLFWPQMGSYVLFSGANEYTAQSIHDFYNDGCEGAILPALAARGIHATHHDWGSPDQIVKPDEAQNARFSKFYREEAIQFIRQHPGTMIYLTWLKTVALLRPNLQLYPATSPAGIMRILLALSLPAWIVIALIYPRKASDPVRAIMVAVMISYALPHLLSGSAPRYRQPIDILCALDLVATLVIAGKERRTLGAPRQRDEVLLEPA